MDFRSFENYLLDGVYFLLGDGHLGPRVVMVSILMLGGEISIVNAIDEIVRNQDLPDFRISRIEFAIARTGNNPEF